jgi:hypothetical protein
LLLFKILLFGFETGYFRFRSCNKRAYSTALSFILLLNLSIFTLLITLNNTISSALNYANHSEYICYFLLILTFDAIAALPFAKLRAENRALYFASIKIFEILLTVALSLFFIVLCPKLQTQNISWLHYVYSPEIGVGYIFLANLIASGSKFLFLIPQLNGLSGGFDGARRGTQSSGGDRSEAVRAGSRRSAQSSAEGFETGGARGQNEGDRGEDRKLLGWAEGLLGSCARLERRGLASDSGGCAEVPRCRRRGAPGST